MLGNLWGSGTDERFLFVDDMAQAGGVCLENTLPDYLCRDRRRFDYQTIG
jgi:hypothetical protein